MHGLVPSWGGRRVGLIGGKILPAHVYHDEEKRWCRLLSGSILFWFVVPPLQPGAVGSYPIWDVWFSSHLLLEGTGRI
jgi:hypothetical protein